MNRHGVTRLMAAATLLLAVACGNEADTGTDPGAATDLETPMEASVPVPRNDEASAYLLTEEDLPEGWRQATGQQDAGTPQMCNVVLEPPEPSSWDTRRYTATPTGPFIVQYSFVSDDQPGTEALMQEWLAAAKDCRTFSSDQGAQVDVSPVSGVGPVGQDFAALNGRTADLEQDYVAFRQGNRMTVLVSFGPTGPAGRHVLDAVVKAVAARG